MAGFFNSMGVSGSMATGGALAGLGAPPGPLNRGPDLGRRLLKQQPTYTNLEPMPGRQVMDHKLLGGKGFLSSGPQAGAPIARDREVSPGANLITMEEQMLSHRNGLHKMRYGSLFGPNVRSVSRVLDTMRETRRIV